MDEYEVRPEVVARRGTEITMYLKEDAKEFLDEFRLRKIITTYSDHIAYPIVMFVEKTLDADKDADKDAEPQRNSRRGC